MNEEISAIKSDTEETAPTELQSEYLFIRAAYEPGLQSQLNEYAAEGWHVLEIFRGVERGAYPSENRFLYQVLMTRSSWVKRGAQ